MGNSISFVADDQFLKLVCKVNLNKIEASQLAEIKMQAQFVQAIENQDENYMLLLFAYELKDFISKSNVVFLFIKNLFSEAESQQAQEILYTGPIHDQCVLQIRD